MKLHITRREEAAPAYYVGFQASQKLRFDLIITHTHDYYLLIY